MTRNPIKNWAITFPQTSCGREDFTESFPPRDKSICCQETHKDGGFHLHLGIALKKAISKANMLKWIKKRWPEDYKRIDVQSTRSIQNWSEYMKKEDPDFYEVDNTTSKVDREKLNNHLNAIIIKHIYKKFNAEEERGAEEIRLLREKEAKRQDPPDMWEGIY